VREYLVNEELDHFRSGWISRREFLRRAGLIGVSAATATAMVRGVTPVKAQPTGPGTSPFHVDADDPRIQSETLWYSGNDGAQLYAYRAWPAGAPTNGSLPGVVVIHQNRGLVEHLMDVARRFAVAGYVAIAPDFVSRTGTPAVQLSSDEQVAAYATLSAVQSAYDALSALDELANHPSVDTNKLAATGYCAGGGVTWRLATLAPQLKAVAPFYGSNPPLSDVPNIKAAVFAVYGELDQNVDAGIPTIEEALTGAGITYQVKIYPNSRHAFHDDTGQAYNAATAPEAYTDTLSWFAQYLNLAPPQM